MKAILGMAAGLILLASCTERQEPVLHPAGWSDDPNSENFHAVKIASSSIQSCRSCHGENYAGGSSQVACNSCHDGGESGHPGLVAWISPDSTDYHGRIFWENGWDFSSCQACHGEDFSGGAADYSCSTCHQEGIESCTTCHGDPRSGVAYPPKDIFNRTDSTLVSVGAHQAHLESNLATVTCDQCHVVPESYLATGHLEEDNVAEVTFGVIATEGGSVTPQWDRNTTTCSEVYCHGNFTSGNISGNKATVNWTRPNSVACGSCHSIPPQGHFGDPPYTLNQCSGCHSSVLDSEGNIIAKSKHVNGQTDY